MTETLTTDQPGQKEFGQEPKLYGNPYQLIDDFEQSPIFQKAFQQKIDELQKENPDRNYNDPILKQKIGETFLGTEPYIEALHEFWQEHKLDLGRLTEKARAGVLKYFDYLENTYNPTIEMIRFRSTDREQEIEELAELSRRRDLAHIEAAQTLYGERIDVKDKDNLETNQNLVIGRQLVHLLACDNELDEPSPGRERYKLFTRRQNEIAADELFNK